jgi:hypothetical protein
MTSPTDFTPGPAERASRPRVVRSRLINTPAPLAWDLVGNLRRHESLIPWTTIDAPDRVTRPGDVIVARSALVIVDRMITTDVRETGDDPRAADWGRWATFRKQGPLLLGEAHIVVRARGPQTCLVVWAEDVHPAFAPDALACPVDLSLAMMSDLALLRLDAALG